MKIGFFAQDYSTGQLAVEIGSEIGYEVISAVNDMKSELALAERMIGENQIESLIVRNPSGHSLSKKLRIPVVILHITRMDIVRAAKQITPDSKIAFLYAPDDKEKYDYDIDELNVMTGQQFRIIPIDYLEGDLLHRKIDDDYFYNRGVELSELMDCDGIVSASPPLIEYMKNCGKEASLISFDPFDLRCALRNAGNAIHARNVEVQNTKVVEMALNSTHYGFIVFRRGTATMVNEVLCNIVGMTEPQILDKKASHLAQSNAFFGRLLDVANKQIITNNGIKYSVFRRWQQTSQSYTESDITAAHHLDLISVINVADLQETEHSIRKQLTDHGFYATWTFDRIISDSPAMTQTLKMARCFALSEFPILITGESGTGKEVLAQSIHNAGIYRDGPFVALNCAAVPEQLLEGELFGHEEGAFTGAKKGGKMGVIELSHNGTLFLDEVGELSAGLQAKLLRVLQERTVRRVGGERMIPVENRLICATNQDLEKAIEEKRFRLDFYYRINVLPIKIPALRERRSDIPIFTSQLLQRYLHAPIEDENFIQTLSRRLSALDWPGNVRQLENFMKLLSTLLDNRQPEESPTDIMNAAFSFSTRPQMQLTASNLEISQDENVLSLYRGTWSDLERQILLQLDQHCEGNINNIAKELQLAYSTIWRKMKAIRNDKET